MEPALVVIGFWVLFGGTHIGLASRPIRARLVARLGESGFTHFFSLIAALSFALLIHSYALHRLDGMRGLALGDIAPIRWLAIVAIVFGVAMIPPSLTSYSRSPYALFSGSAVPSARGLERITRHPIFAGFALVALAHVLVAPRLTGTAFAAGLAVVTIAGAWHQDRKFAAKRGPAFAEYLTTTSAVPFAAILAGRQRLVLNELPWGMLAVGVGLAFVLRLVHESIFSAGGAWVIAAVLTAAVVATVQSWRRGRRSASGATSTLPVG